jgi:PAS domain-containing protein
MDLTARSSAQQLRWLSFSTRAASVAVLLLGGVTLLGWLLEIPTLTSVVPGGVAMNPTTALAFMVGALALWLQRARPVADARREGPVRLASGGAALVAVLGLLTLVGYLLGRNLGLDQVLLRGQLGGNRIAPNTGLNFLLVGGALALLDTETRRGARPAQWLALLTAVIAASSLLGYAYGVGALYGIASYIPMALNTALAFALLALGILGARPDRGLMAVVTSDSAGGVMLRRLLPAALGLPAVLGWAVLRGDDAGLYDAAFGVSLLVALSAALFAVLIGWTAWSLDRTDRQRRQAEAALARQYRAAEDARSQTRAVLDATSEAIVFLSPDRRVLGLNRPVTDLFGLSPDRAAGRRVEDLQPELERIFADGAAVAALLGGPPDGAAAAGAGPVGSGGAGGAPAPPAPVIVVQRWPARRELELFSAPVRGADGAHLGWLYAFRDVTDEREVARLKEERRRQLEEELARAARVQADLLPRDVPALPGFELAARCLPAREVGGDFFDWHEPAPGLLTLTLGDVMGKGMPAALLMATVRAALEAVARQSPPAGAVHAVAGAVERDLERSGSFVTLFHARADVATRRIEFVDAGHGHVFVRRVDGRAEGLQPRGLPLGVLPEQAYQQGTVTLAPGDALVVYSDGLVDARPELALTPDAFAGQLEGAASALEIVDRLVALAAPAGPLPDDLTLVVLRCRPEAATAPDGGRRARESATAQGADGPALG